MSRVELIRFDLVPENGVLGEGAQVPVDGLILMSPPDGGCGITGCKCVRGHFVARLFERDSQGCVWGYVVEFDSRQELESTSPRDTTSRQPGDDMTDFFSARRPRE